MINEQRAKSYCKEDISKIENYEKAIADTTKMWHCHHILGEILTRQQLLEHDFYYDVPACMLKFVTKAEHTRLHKKGKHHSEESINKMSEANKGKHRSGEIRNKISEALKGRTFSEETHIKMSEAQKGKHHTEETRKKISESHKGKPSLNKGKTASIFGKAFKEHYGITRCDNDKLYLKEYSFYKYHGHFSWEVK